MPILWSIGDVHVDSALHIRQGGQHSHLLNCSNARSLLLLLSSLLLLILLLLLPLLLPLPLKALLWLRLLDLLEVSVSMPGNAA
jgi:hypothetical protein